MSIPIAFISTLLEDPHIFQDKGLLYGFDAWVWASVTITAVNGLLVAMTVKYADNILKGFAASIAIVLSTIMAIYLGDCVLSMGFVAGTIITISSVFLYSQPQSRGSSSAAGGIKPGNPGLMVPNYTISTAAAKIADSRPTSAFTRA